MGSLSQPPHFPAIIVGCGPCGLTTAINIAKAGIKTLILERWETVDKSPRAAAYQPCAQAELLETGTLDDVKAHSVINDIITFWSGGKRVCSVAKREGGKIFNAAINCPQPKLAEILLEHLTSKYESDVRFSQKVVGLEQEADLVRVTAEDPRTGELTVYTADWVVGADGAGSGVRKLSEIEFEGFSWPKEDFVATNVRNWSLDPFFEEGFTAANMILHAQHWAVVTILDKTGLWRCAFGVKAGMTNDEIRQEVNEHYKHIFPNWEKHGACYELVELNKYKPHQRCAATFRKGRVLLAGDAAHSNNPIGGLGLTTGLLDAGPLGRGLAAVISGKAPESILDIWAQARRDKWLTYTNGFSIENKRIIQQGGYSDDPLGIWELDDVAREHNMEQWLQSATKDKKEADLAMYKAMEDPEVQLASRMKQWDITIDPLWMAEYEDPELIKLRMSLRPAAYQVPVGGE